MTRVLSLPGYLGSGPEHWQTHWERLDTRIQRVEQARWDAPECAAWCAALESAVMADLRPTVLVGHSLGAVTVVQWAGRTRASHVAGALLVAPADVEHLPPELGDFSSFSPLPRERAAFALDTRLAGDCFVVGESALSLLLLMNDARYPWFILVPKRSAVSEFFDLDDTDQRALARESQVLTQALAETFDADKMNTGALGNVVRQLHLHHVVRRLGDPAWPGPVWGHSPRQPYGSGTERNLIAKIFAHPAVAAHFDPVL
jgi:diadenosine tetraphosphate (Ap4A) HIT family hydrolase